MANPFNIENPLQRDGNSQRQRDIAMRQPDQAAIDGRTTLDVLHFWKQFAKEVKFYNLEGNVQDWTPFFQASIPFQLATIAQFDAEKWWSTYQTLREKTVDIAADPNALEFLMGHLFDAFAQHQSWHYGLLDTRATVQVLTMMENKTPVSLTVWQLTETNLRFLLREFIGISNVLMKEPFSLTPFWNPQFFSNTEGGAVWQLNEADTKAEDPILNNKRGTRRTLLPSLLMRLDRIAELIYKAQRQILASFPQSDKGLDELILNNESHEPHLGLMFAFLRLFKIVQGDMNGLTERHLDYFYREILCFKERAAIPDKAHLVFELAKQLPSPQLLKAQTGFKDGKDINKAEIIFETDEELVLNRAEVAEVRTLFVDKVRCSKTEQNCESKIQNCELKIVATDKADQAKAIETERKLPTKQLYTFQQATNIGNWASLGEITTDVDRLGKVGFIISSPVFRAKEGVCSFTIDFTFKNPLINPCEENKPLSEKELKAIEDNLKALLDIHITTEKDWIRIEASVTINEEKSQNSKLPTLPPSAEEDIYFMRLTFKLSKDYKPTEPLKDLKQNPYGLTEASIRIVLKNNSPKFTDLYNLLNVNEITKIEVKCEASDITKNIALQNAEGILDAQKPFQPFGTQAKHALLIGSSELDNKKIESLTANVIFDSKSSDAEWEKAYLPFIEIPIKTGMTFKSTLQRDNGDVDLEPSQPLFDDNTWSWLETPVGSYVFPPLSMADKFGFVKLNMSSDDFFKNKSYQEMVDVQLRAIQIYPKWHEPAYYKGQDGTVCKLLKASDINANDNVKPEFTVAFPTEQPYNPTLTSFSLSYTAADDVASFLQLYPFADDFLEVKKTNYVEDKEVETFGFYLKTLLPKFEDKFVDEGNLYIGLKNAQINNSLSLLFQFADYSGNADLKIDALNLSILVGNTWQPLQNLLDYEDNTEGFTQSGILHIFKILDDSKADKTTILPADKRWLRITAVKNAAAFDHLVAIKAQAALATFKVAPENDLTRLVNPLVAGSVKKPVQENAALAKIDQPFDSFGGRAVETSTAFYRRVSERLRHKGRAINLWDYEMLVLQAFPEIYKAKCLPHTALLRDASLDLEFVVGRVALIVVPDVTKLPLAVRDEPKANQNLLHDILAFLNERVTPFVTLDVLSPRYEPVKAQFNVQFYKGKDEVFYKKQLEKDIKIFLSPWTSDKPKEIQFGGEIQASSLLNFIEQQAYVDYVSDFNMLEDGVQTRKIRAKTARSVLKYGSMDITVIPCE